MAELADAQASGACGSNIVRVQVPLPALFFQFCVFLFFSILMHDSPTKDSPGNYTWSIYNSICCDLLTFCTFGRNIINIFNAYPVCFTCFQLIFPIYKNYLPDFSSKFRIFQIDTFIHYHLDAIFMLFLSNWAYICHTLNQSR